MEGETYRIFITNEDTIEEVLAAQRGDSQAVILNGKLINGSVDYNKLWSWHIDSEDIYMAESTIELSDGLPSQVEAWLDYWLNNGKRFSPWSGEDCHNLGFQIAPLSCHSCLLGNNSLSAK